MPHQQLVSNKVDVFGASVVLENDDVLAVHRFLGSAKLVVGSITLRLRRAGRTAAVQRHKRADGGYEEKCDNESDSKVLHMYPFSNLRKSLPPLRVVRLAETSHIARI